MKTSSLGHRCLWLTAAFVCALPVAAAPGGGFQVERYDLKLRADLRSGAVSGHETVIIKVTGNTSREITFSPNALRITDAKLDGAPVPVQSGNDGILFTLPQSLRRGDRAVLSFDIAGVPARGITLTPAGMHAGYFACDWMVCLQDAPGDKADFNLDLFVPKGVTSLGVGERYASLDAFDGLAMHRYRSVRPLSPYLFAFAAGDYPEETVSTPQGILHYLNATGEPADLSDLFAQTPAMVAFLADRAGIGLPGRSYAQLLVPHREAQETADFSLIGTDELAREREDPSSAWVIAHELAHQWWGNSVTTRTWRDFWLNEGFATFMVAAWEEHRLGEAAYQQELDVYRDRRAQLRERGWDKPLAWDGKYPSLGYRRAVQYSKGALFLATLREVIGDDAFWNGIRAYTRCHADGTVTSQDLQNAMEAASGRSLAPIFSEWVYGDQGDDVNKGG